MTTRQWLRGRILHCVEDSAAAKGWRLQYFADGVLGVSQGLICELDRADHLQSQGLDLNLCRQLPDTALLVPGFVDTHVHAPQLGIIASYGEQLLAWLERYTFPAEAAFANPDYAQEAMAAFIEQMLRQGTTSAAVFATRHEQATDQLFTAAARENLCLITGKVLMDRNAPDNLCDTDTGIQASTRLIERWHKSGRLHYAVTPRFAITSTAGQLQAAGQLLARYPDLYMQTHLSETEAEVNSVKQLFPDSQHYLDTYDQYGLCTDRSLFGHCIHLQTEEIQRLQQTGSVAIFCPSSNLFLGSGLFPLQHMEQSGVRIGIGSDVGAGTSLSMFKTLGDAYKACQLQGSSLAPEDSFYRITLGNAQALGLQHQIGHLQPGSDADFIILDAATCPAVHDRCQPTQSIEDLWFACTILGDERLIKETWVAGRAHNWAETTPRPWPPNEQY